MVKSKKLYAVCRLCNKQVTLEVPLDLAKDREYYPFEYIDIHGTPEHALMLLLDQDLAVRDAIAYSDLRIVKNKSKQYKTLVKMSEIDSFASIYTNPIRLKLFKLLTEGPYTEEDLIDKLKENNGFIEEEFNMMMLPLIRNGLVKTKLLQDTFQMGYFLIKDFIVLRVPAKITANLFKKNPHFKPYSEIYFKLTNTALTKFKENFLASTEDLIQETRLCLQIRSELKYFSIYNSLWTGPITLEDLLKTADKKSIEELISKGFIDVIKTQTETYYVLLTEIAVQKFTPKYLINAIIQKLRSNDITKEMALYHLDYIFDADAK